MNKRLTLSILLTLLFAISISAQIRVDEVASPASISINRSRGLNMLDDIKDLIKERYYDKNYRGIDIDARFKVAKEKIKTLDYNAQIFHVIAAVVLEFNDSHTRFYPPNRANRIQYGFAMQMIGNDCYVISVAKGSDAKAKGLKAGDQLVGIENFNINRDSLWQINYLLYTLNPRESIKLYVLQPDKTEKEISVKAGFKTLADRRKEAEKRRSEKAENPYKCQKVNADTIACKLYTFSVDKKFIDQMMKEVGTHKKFILDLRGNGGGYVKIEEYLTGHFFDHDIKIADFVMRNKTSARVAKTQKEKVYKGDLIVLLDSNSASASEVFARVIQVEKRGKIVGDVSAGAVMTSNFITMVNSRGVPGSETFSTFAMNITIADLIMSDGKRLENVGVIPDYRVGPTGLALRMKTDPILSYSLGLMGTEITPEEAGKYYFLTKKEEDEDDKEDSKNDDDN